MCVRYVHCKDTGIKLVTCLTNITLKKSVEQNCTFFKFIIIKFHQSFFFKKDMNNFLDIPKTDMAQLYDIPVRTFMVGGGGAGSSGTVIIR